MKRFRLHLVVLVFSAIGSAQQSSPPAIVATPVGRSNDQPGVATPQESRDSISEVKPPGSYPDTAEGLERMMGDMVSLQQRGETAALAPYLQSLILPDADNWFTARFGNLHCGEEHLAANDCMGPRLAYVYRSFVPILPASFALTLADLTHERLTNFEATNYTEPCPGPQRIVGSQKLVGGLTTTPFLSPTLSGLVQHLEPTYVLWIYNDTKETTLPFFVYSQGAFRYIGMFHPASIEDFQEKSATVIEATGPAVSARYLTEDQLDMEKILIDPAVVQRTVVLQVVVGSDGKPKEVTYVRGNNAYKDTAIRRVEKRRFDSTFGPYGFHFKALTFCLNVESPR